jgi:hypothetical protein
MRLNSILGKGEVKDYQEKLQKQLMRRLNKKEAHLLGRYREKEEQWELICYFYVLSEIDFQEEKRRFLKENKTKK